MIVAAGCAPQPGPHGTSDGTGAPALIEGDVLEVVDGDTFTLGTSGGEVRIRLLGINAPERDECLHDEAAAELGSYLGAGEMRVEDHGRDQFGRSLVYVWVGETFVNLALVEAGLVFATTPGEGETQGASLLTAEAAAVRTETGLWNPASCNGGSATGLELAIDASGYDPPGPDDEVLEQEHVRVVNRSGGVADLSGWILRDESSLHRFRFPDGSIIDPGGDFDVPSTHPGWEPGGSPVWNNEGDMALLLTPEGGFAVRERYRP